MATSPSPSSSTAGVEIGLRADPEVGVRDSEVVEWRLAAERTSARTFGVLVAMVLAAVLGVVVGGQPIFALLGPLLILPVAAQYWLAPTYRLDAEKARAKWGLSVTEILWKDVARVRETEGGDLHLSPLEREDVRQRFRGVVLRLPGDPKERKEIETFVRGKVTPAHGAE